MVNTKDKTEEEIKAVKTATPDRRNETKTLSLGDYIKKKLGEVEGVLQDVEKRVSDVDESVIATSLEIREIKREQEHLKTHNTNQDCEIKKLNNKVEEVKKEISGKIDGYQHKMENGYSSKVVIETLNRVMDFQQKEQAYENTDKQRKHEINKLKMEIEMQKKKIMTIIVGGLFGGTGLGALIFWLVQQLVK